MMPSASELIASRAALTRAGGENVPSPCVNICRMDATTAWCEGCFRTLEEIAGWGRQDDDTKRAIWQQIELRIAQRV
jgi:uncharacterized protein